MSDIKPIAMPGTHEKFLAYFKKDVAPSIKKILDVGAGHGAFTKQLHEMGYEMAACDLFPEYYRYDQVKCVKADLTQTLPFDTNSFDAIIAIEVMEHTNDHEVFFREASRILKKGGVLYISTPNILSLKSRLRFLWSGFYYSFQPLDIRNYDGLQHVSSLTLDQYNYIAIKNGFEAAELEIDKMQKSSRWLLFLYPLLWLYGKLKNIAPIHNTLKLLTGRLLFLKFRNL